MTPIFQPTISNILSALESVAGFKPQRCGNGWKCRCPAHDDHTPSLSIHESDNGKALLRCHAGCSYESITAALGLDRKTEPQSPKNGARQPIIVYSYHNPSGVEVRQKLRFEPKDFRIRHQGADGQWVYKAGSGAPVLYRLPEVLAAIAKGETVFICEGERDSDRLAGLGLTATTNIEGAAQPGQKSKWRPVYTEQLKGAARVVLLPDNDDPGRAHMKAIAAALQGKVGAVVTLELPGLPAKGDVSDWLNQGHTADELRALAESAVETKAEPSAIFDTAAPLLKGNGRLVKHNRAASIIKKSEFDGRIFYDPTSASWWKYAEAKGIFERRQQTDIETIVCRSIERLSDDADFDASYVGGVTRMLTYKAADELQRPTGSICFRNGVLDLATRRLHPHSSAFRFTAALPFDWEPDAPDPKPVIDWLLWALNNKSDQVQLLRAWIHACLVGRPDLQRFLELVGYGGSGKGTFLRLLTALLGEQAYHSTELKHLEGNRFETAKIFGKKLVFVSDAEKWRGDISVLKALTGQDPLRFEEKHRQGGNSFVYEGMVMILANQHVESSDYSSAIPRRRITLLFDRSVPVEQHRDLTAEFEPYLPAVIRWALDMPAADVTRYLRATGAAVPSLKSARLDALRATNPIAGWLMDSVVFDPNEQARVGDCRAVRRTVGGITRTEYEHADDWLYANYRRWCDRTNDRRPVALRAFTRDFLDVAKNVLGKRFLESKRVAAGTYIFGCRLMKDYEGTMKDEVIDCEENEGYGKNNSPETSFSMKGEYETTGAGSQPPDTEKNCGESENDASSLHNLHNQGLNPSSTLHASFTHPTCSDDAKRLWADVLRKYRGSETVARLAKEASWDETRTRAALAELTQHGRVMMNGDLAKPIHPGG